MKRLNPLFLQAFFISSISTIAYAHDGQVKESNIIKFTDAAVKQLCVANWDTDGDGNLSYDEAMMVNDIGKVFYDNDQIWSFKELQYFTGLTRIPYEAFSKCVNMTSIQIPENVAIIEDYAFNDCSRLSSIIFPNGLTSIGNYSFRGCSNIKDITLPDNIICLGEWSFSSCGMLTSIILPNNLERIGAFAFFGCSDLTSVYIPKFVNSIAPSAFECCYKLTSISVNEDNPFYDSRNACNAIIESASNKLVRGCKNTIIPAGVTEIGDYAFRQSGINSIQLPNTIVQIGNWAFSACDLTSITIPQSVVSIGDYAFYDSWYLASIIIPESVSHIGSGALEETPWYNNHANGLIYVGSVAYKYKGIMLTNTEINIAEGIKEISSSAFFGCKGLISIKLPNTIQAIGPSAFGGCVNLESIILSENLSSIGETSFTQCKFNSITIPSSVVSIGNSAFSGNSNLTSVSILGENTFVGQYAFSACDNLIYVHIKKSAPQNIISSTFSNRKNATLIVPLGCKAVYEVADYWKEFKEIVEERPKNIEFADENVKKYCVAQWDSDGDGELSYDEAAAVTNIKNVFTNKNRIHSFDELEYFTGLTRLNMMAFASCASLTSIRIPENVKEIGLSAFSGCSSLESITLPEGLEELGTSVFIGCSTLKEMAIPEMVTSIGSAIFSNCPALESITVADGNTVYDSREHCNAIIQTASNTLIEGCKSTIIPESVTSIDTNAFTNCTSLESISIPRSVTSIGTNAFSGCTALTSVSVDIESPPAITSSTFSNCENATLYVPYRSVSAYSAADYWKDFKEIVEIVPPTETTLIDGDDYNQASEEQSDFLHYSRTFKNTNWQAWYVPFDVKLTSDILEHFAFAEFAGTYTEEDGSFYITVVRLKEGDIVKANTPYCVQAKVADSANPHVITQTDVTLKAAEVSSFYVLSARKKITFFGNYTRRSVTAEDMSLYALSGGKYSKQQPGNTLAPYRCFFTIEDREDNPYATAPNPTEVKLMVIGDDETVIAELNSNKGPETIVYELNGRRIKSQNINRGIYIINGKKVIVK